MENKEILEGNKLIAEFMGWQEPSLEYKIKWCGVKTEERLKKINEEYIPYLIKEKNSEPLFKDSLRYHSSWDWLMPVVEKIAELDIAYRVGIVLIGYVKINGFQMPPIVKNVSREGSLINPTWLNATWLAVVEFINWYNDNGK